MHFVLIAPSDETTIRGGDPNEGYNHAEIHSLLEKLTAGGDSFESINSDALSDEDRERRYFEASVHAAQLRIRINDQFGSAGESGASGFGREVPALLVYDKPDGTLTGIYPHKASGHQLETIAGYLTQTA